MDAFWEKSNTRKSAPSSLRSEVRELRNDLQNQTMSDDTAKKGKKWKIPFSWRSKMNKSLRKNQEDKVLVLYLNKKGEIEPPRIMPIYSGNIVVIKSKPYEFDPRAVWTMHIKSKFYKMLLIKEIDRRPITNLDLDEIRARGDSTDSDEFLIKMALRAVQKEQMKEAGKYVAIIVILAIVGAAIYFFTR